MHNSIETLLPITTTQRSDPDRSREIVFSFCYHCVSYSYSAVCPTARRKNNASVLASWIDWWYSSIDSSMNKGKKPISVINEARLMTYCTYGTPPPYIRWWYAVRINMAVKPIGFLGHSLIYGWLTCKLFIYLPRWDIDQAKRVLHYIPKTCRTRCLLVSSGQPPLTQQYRIWQRYDRLNFGKCWFCISAITNLFASNATNNIEPDKMYLQRWDHV